MQVVAGVDLGGTAINYTLVNQQEQFLIEGLCEHPALSKQGPDVCLKQIEDGLKIAAEKAQVIVGHRRSGPGHPRPGQRGGITQRQGFYEFRTSGLGRIRYPRGAGKRLGKPVAYLNDGNAGALWGHFTIFGANSRETSVSVVIGTGLGGGIIIDGNVVKGRMGFGGELGHVLIPYQSIAGTAGLKPECNCGRTGDLESVCSLTAIEKSLLPFFLPRYPGHELAKLGNLHQAAKLVRGLADKGDALSRDIFRVQAHGSGPLLR